MGSGQLMLPSYSGCISRCQVYYSDVPSNRAINDASVYTPDVHTPRERVTKLERIIDTKDDVISAKDDTINDLRSRLNVEQEERRRLSMLLVDQATPAKAAKPKGFWARLFGGGE